MRIGIDMFGLQSPARRDDLGVATRQLVNQFLSRFPRHDWILFFYEGLEGADDRWPGTPELRYIRRTGPELGLRNSPNRLADGADPMDVLLVTGALERHEDYLPPLKSASGPRMAALVYDLLSAQMSERYLTKPSESECYYWALRRLRQYDLLLAVSESARNTGVELLDFSPDGVVNIGPDASGNGKPAATLKLFAAEAEPAEGQAWQTMDFSWSAAADRAVAALEAMPQRTSRGPAPRRHARPKQRIAYFSPLPPARSGISDYSRRLLESLKELYTIDLFHDASYFPRLGLGAHEFSYYDYRLFPRFQRSANYAGIVYQMGNSGFHGFVYDTLLEYPGLVVLHDFVLTDLHYWYSLQPGADKEFLPREIERESPALAEEYRMSGTSWANEPGGIIEACNRRGLAMNRRVLAQAAGLVVHDSWSAERIRALRLPSVPHAGIVPHGASLYVTPDDEKARIRGKFGLDDEQLVVGCFGILHTIKYPVEVVESFHALSRVHPTAQLLFVGRDVSGGVVQAKVDELGIADRVRFIGHVSMESFLQLMAITDIGVNLRRPPTRGETSGALLTLLGSGVPTIVSDVDAFSVYPSTVVEKIGPLTSGDRALERALFKLAERPDLRRKLGEAATRYVDEVHNWPRAAGLYAAAIDGLRAERSAPRPHLRMLETNAAI
jgi:glycosyltransferase involved in cell wall biosynthesis